MSTTIEQNRAAGGARNRNRQAHASRRRHAAVSEIGPIPPVVNPLRKEMCRHDLLLFLQTYFPHSTGLSPFSADHIKAIDRIERAVLTGGRFLNCMPRGYSKSTIAENAAIWAHVYGHRAHTVLLAVSKEAAGNSLESIKLELEQNERLAEDFPEVCFPIECLGGISQRCDSQTHLGERTYIKWKADAIVLPRIPGSPASEGIIRTRPFTNARGTKHKTSDGRQVRPDFVIVDDPLTEIAAYSPMQNLKLMSTLRKSVLKLGGHGVNLSCVINATIIAEGDFIDTLADRSKHPEWQTIRCKMVIDMPEHLDDEWLGKYADLRGDYDPDDLEGQEKAHAAATAYYLANREKMDLGARVSWENIPLKEGEVSALQHAMNMLVDDEEEAFYSECQNEPKRPQAAGIAVVKASEVEARTSSFERFVVPPRTSHLVFHCDVHDAILYYSVLAIESDFTGRIIDYGTFPEQPNNRFNMWTIKRKLQDEVGADSVEEAIIEGVRHVADDICGRLWMNPDGESLPISCGFFDCGYLPDPVAMGIRMSQYSQVLAGSRGVGIGPGDKPMTMYDTSPKRVITAGPNRQRPRWYVPTDTLRGMGMPVIRFDSNYWKSVVAARLTQARHTPGEWSLYGNHRADHSAYAEHLTAEEPVPTSAKGATVVVWRDRGRENHWWDTLVGCAVAASYMGIRLPNKTPIQQRPKPQQKRPQQSKLKSGGLRMPDGRPFFLSARR